MLKGKVSVIVPVYNTERSLLERSIGSVLSSTYPDIELILVDDGSGRDTVELLQYLAASDERIQVFPREHEGVVSARQYGVQQSGGRWIMFLDSDDFIDPDMIRGMLSSAEELSLECPDMILADWIREPARICREPLEIGAYDMRDKAVWHSILDKVFQTGQLEYINDSFWGKLFERNLAEKITPMVDRRIIQGEDLCFMVLALVASGRIVNTGVTGVHYCPRIDSVSAVKNTHCLANLDVMYNSVKESLRELGDAEEQEYLAGKWRETIRHTVILHTKFLLE